MDLGQYHNDIEEWFLAHKGTDFPDNIDYVAKYKSIKDTLKPIHKQVTAGADSVDDTSLTWHDESHIMKVIKQASCLLSYKNAYLTPYEGFALLVAIQIHDVKNIDGRQGHEERATTIFSELNIAGLVDSFLLKYIGKIASCHAGSILVGERRDRDKISYLQLEVFRGEKKLRLRFLAAILRLADEYSDDSNRAMSYLLSTNKIKTGSIIHQKHAECLTDVEIAANTGIVNFDYHLPVQDALIKFPKYIKEKETFEDWYLLDEIFERTLKSHHETVYCMRYLRPDITISKLHIDVTVENLELSNQFSISYEIIEKGYPNTDITLKEICGDDLKKNGSDVNGEYLKNHLESILKVA